LAAIAAAAVKEEEEPPDPAPAKVTKKKVPAPTRIIQNWRQREAVVEAAIAAEEGQAIVAEEGLEGEVGRASSSPRR
jgi:hypothetical protein